MSNSKKFLYAVIPGCPASHPYAYLNGDYCCKTKEERPNGGLQSEIDDGTCDGVDFNLESTCCNNSDYTPCPDPNGCGGKFDVKSNFQFVYQ